MAKLVPPSVSVRESFLAALPTYHTEGRYLELDPQQLAGAFTSYIADLRAKSDPTAPRPAGRVVETVLWYVDGNEYVGRLNIRHELNERLRRIGGHIGYEVKLSARRQGHATRMFTSALPLAHALGIEQALVTCDANNNASRKIIERGGGVLQAAEDGILRFWVPTAGASPTGDARLSRCG